MDRTFEYTFNKLELTVQVRITYTTYLEWIDAHHPQVHLDEVTIVSVKCGDWNIENTLKNDAPAGTWRELKEACWEYALQD